MNNQTQEALKMALNAMANKMESDNNGNPLTKYDEALQEAMDAGVEALATNKDSSLVQPAQGIELEWYNKGWTDANFEWKGLTDDEIDEIMDGDICQSYYEMLGYARVIEQALKEKNHG